MSLHPFGGHIPRVAPDAFVAPGAQLIGDVEIGAGASVWYNCVLRGDLNRIVVGPGTNIQDGSIVHVDSGRTGAGSANGRGSANGPVGPVGPSGTGGANGPGDANGAGGANGPGHPALIGAHVLIGHLAIVHGATLMDGCFVGMGAIVMDGCVIEEDAMLAAGALLTPGKRIPAGELWAGRPAKFMRALTPEQRALNTGAAPAYAKLAAAHRAALSAEN